MSDPNAIVVITIAGCTAAVFAIKAIANGVLKVQENQLKYRSGSGLLAGAAEERLARIEQSLDAIAVEVERISEGQRFTTKLLSERTPDTGRT